MERIKEICRIMIQFELDHTESCGKHIYRAEDEWIYAEGSTPIVQDESLEVFLAKIEELYNGCF